jgi:hypothetical protein
VEPWDESGDVILSAHIPNIIWTSLGNGIYRGLCTAAPYDVIDLKHVTDLGNGRRYEQVESESDVFSRRGSFWLSGSYITVNALDGRYPDAQLLVMSGQSNGRYDTTGRLFVRNVQFWGGFKPFQCTTTSPGQVSTFVNCRFMYSMRNQDGFAMQGPGTTIAINCIATGNHADGYDYRDGRNFVEIDCQGYGNGAGITNLDNGTTAHFGCIGISIGGRYHSNWGRNIHDVYDSKRLILGGHVGNSLGDPSSNADIVSGAGDTNYAADSTQIWIIGMNYDGGSTYARSTLSNGRIWSRRHVANQPDLEQVVGRIRPL